MHLAHQWARGFSLDGECFGLHHECTDAFVGVAITLEMAMSDSALCTSLQDCQKQKTVRWTGTWRLAPRRAMSLLPRQDSQLLIVHGTAWISWEKPIGHWARSDGDHFLEAGQIVDVPAGAHLVMEARHSGEMVHFDWREMPKDFALHRLPQATLPELLQQWRQAWGQVGGASARLVRGLCRLRLGRLTAGDLPA
jgi:hypothetical protein